MILFKSLCGLNLRLKAEALIYLYRHILPVRSVTKTVTFLKPAHDGGLFCFFPHMESFSAFFSARIMSLLRVFDRELFEPVADYMCRRRERASANVADSIK